MITIFTTVFGRRLGTVTDGTTKRTSLQVRTGENIDVSGRYNDVFSATTRDLDLKQDKDKYFLSSKQFSLTARASVDRGFAYAGFQFKNYQYFALSSYGTVNGIELEEGTGVGEDNEDGGATSGADVGSIQLEQDMLLKYHSQNMTI